VVASKNTTAHRRASLSSPAGSNQPIRFRWSRKKTAQVKRDAVGCGERGVVEEKNLESRECKV